MSHKRSFLLASARRLPNPVDISAHYDEHQQLNVSHGGGRPHPLALHPNGRLDQLQDRDCARR